MLKLTYGAVLAAMILGGISGCKPLSESFSFSVNKVPGRSVQQLVFFTDTVSLRQLTEATVEDTVRYHGVITLLLTDSKGVLPKTVTIPCVLLVEKNEFLKVVQPVKKR